MAVAVFRHREAAPVRLHVEIAARDIVDGLVDFKTKLAAEERGDEVGEPQITIGPADVRPLLVVGEERAVKTGRDAMLEEQFPRKLRRNRGRTPRTAELRQKTAADLLWHLPFHDPQGEPDTVPSQVAKAAVRFEMPLCANVAGKEFLGSAEAERGSDALDLPDSSAVFKRRAYAVQPFTVHEHHAIEELHPMARARLDHLPEVG